MVVAEAVVGTPISAITTSSILAQIQCYENSIGTALQLLSRDITIQYIKYIKYFTIYNMGEGILKEGHNHIVPGT